MGKRGPLDFLLLYAYAIAGALLSFVHFNLLCPIKRFNARQWGIHVFETVLKAAVYWLGDRCRATPWRARQDPRRVAVADFLFLAV